jgi:orotidine-5'-phosphate decarboxylase
MDFLELLRTATAQNDSMLCVGLDPDPERFPGAWRGDARKMYDFCAAIVDHTADLVCAFKPQIAYFAAHGAEEQLERLLQHIRCHAPQVPVILDAKRGDIGATAEQYAKEAFERYGADAVTLSPFMGFDSVAPYLDYPGKGAFLLCRTSNPGGDDLQNQRLASVPGAPLLYEHIARLAQGPWNRNGQLGLVVGATYPAEIERVLLAQPAVLDAAVVRRPDPRWGEVPVAFVAFQPGARADVETLAQRCREALAGYKVPKEIRIVAVEDFPRSSTGKIQRHEIERQWL